MEEIMQAKRRTNSVHFLFGAVVIGVILFVVLEVIAQLLPPHYSPLSQSESDLAVGQYGFLMASGFAIGGILLLLFITGFTRVIPKVARSRGGLILLSIAAVCKLIIAFAQTDLTARPQTLHGAVHALAAVISFFCGSLGVLLLARALRREPQLLLPERFLLTLASITFTWTILVIATLVVSSQIGVWGLFERVATGLYLLWILIASLNLWRTSALQALVEQHSSPYPGEIAGA